MCSAYWLWLENQIGRGKQNWRVENKMHAALSISGEFDDLVICMWEKFSIWLWEIKRCYSTYTHLYEGTGNFVNFLLLLEKPEVCFTRKNWSPLQGLWLQRFQLPSFIKTVLVFVKKWGDVLVRKICLVNEVCSSKHVNP